MQSAGWGRRTQKQVPCPRTWPAVTHHGGVPTNAVPGDMALDTAITFRLLAYAVNPAYNCAAIRNRRARRLTISDGPRAVSTDPSTTNAAPP